MGTLSQPGGADLTRADSGPTVETMLVRSIQDLDLQAATPRVLVPTMGALHDGHAALISHARELADRLTPRGAVIATVFVNPSQFNERTDFERYPRDLDRDVELASLAGVDRVYAPAVEEVYPPGEAVPVGDLPEVATMPGLEDRFRPGHFEGVQQVVRRLFELTKPQIACFGEKDWQQFAVIRAMVEGENLPIHIVPVPTIREESGLAMSSRNRLLTDEERQEAVWISRALAEAFEASSPAEAESRMSEVLERPSLRVEYATVRDARTLLPIAQGTEIDRPLRALIAAWVEGVRLIDNGPACARTGGH